MGDSGDTMLLPIVKWAQRKDNLSLSVQLQESQHPSIVLKSGSLEFKAIGIGAKGLNLYGFTLDFFKVIQEKSCVHKITGSSVEIFLTKEGAGEWWPRLTLLKKSPHFLKLDFDKWRSESDDEEKSQQDDGFDPSLLENLRQERENERQALIKSRNGYLMIYNVMQFIVFAYIFSLCLINLVLGGTKFFPVAYDHCGNVVHFAVMFSVMEVIHPLTGIMKGPWLTPLMQVFGRNFALFCIWLAADHIKHMWFITILFMTWSGIELIRYPYYLLQIMKRPSPVITWLRYTAWIPLYPLGALLEILVYINVIWALTEHGIYELQLPNAFNFSLKFAWVIRVYLGLFPFGMINMLRHMWKMRCRRYGGRKYKQP